MMTIYGDAIAPRGQSIWLGSLISLLELFGLSHRLVRTSAFRLTAGGWLTPTHIGRRSYYALSQTGLQRVQHAQRRIYEFDPPAWDGLWTLALLDHRLRASVRQDLRRELQWEGFGQISPNLFAHPQVDHQSLQEILKTKHVEDHVAVLSASHLAAYSHQALEHIMHQTFSLGEVAAAWEQLITRFEPIQTELHQLDPAESFFVRTLLIHEYRRVLLRDPHLPEALLPKDWEGLQGRQLCKTIYQGVRSASELFLTAHLEIAPTA